MWILYVSHDIRLNIICVAREQRVAGVVNKVETYADKYGTIVVPFTEGSQPFGHKQIHKTILFTVVFFVVVVV